MKKISLDSISKQKDPADAEREQQLRTVRSAAIRHIGIASRSSGAVRSFLLHEGFSDDIITDVIAGLFEEGYLDDNRPARRILRERQAGKAESQSALRSRLLRQGVSLDVVDAVSEDMVPDAETALELVRSRFGRDLQAFASLDREAKRRQIGKIGRFMQSRGYAVPVISTAIAKVLAEVGADPDENTSIAETPDD